MKLHRFVLVALVMCGCAEDPSSDAGVTTTDLARPADAATGADAQDLAVPDLAVVDLASPADLTPPEGGWAELREPCGLSANGKPCRPELACCYPCGIPGCTHTCTIPCQPDGGLQGAPCVMGCILYN